MISALKCGRREGRKGEKRSGREKDGEREEKGRIKEGRGGEGMSKGNENNRFCGKSFVLMYFQV